MKAITLCQPWASLLVTRQPCYCWGHLAARGPHPMVKRWETRSWPFPPALIGQRIAIHAAARPVRQEWNQEYGPSPWTDGPDWVPRLYEDHEASNAPGNFLWVFSGPLGAVVGSCIVTASLPIADEEQKLQRPHLNVCGKYLTVWDPDRNEIDISDQLPYGDWTPSRFAWEVADVRPLTTPVSVKGRQRIWELDEATTAEVIRCGG